MDLASTFRILGISESHTNEQGIATYKVGMTWPLETSGNEQFALGLDLLFIIEEKRGLIEAQIKEILYGNSSAPKIIGKRDEEGKTFFPAKGARGYAGIGCHWTV